MQQQATGSARVPTVDGFRDLVVLGSGGFATVYSATDDHTGEQVALKVLPSTAGDHRRFQRECRILGQLGHIDGIVAVRQATFTEDGRPVIVTDLCPGGTLAERTEADPMAPLDVLTMGVKLAVVLELSHRHGVFHRDVKPANVMFDADGQPALVDFGIAFGDGQTASTTTYHSLSPPHAPPERIRDDSDVEPRLGDIWSLGATLYTALSGTPPFGTAEQGGLMGLVTRITEAPLPPIERTDLPDGLEDVLRSTMEKDPIARPASMDVLVARLWEARERAIDTTVAPRPYPGAERALALLERIGEAPDWTDGAFTLADPTIPESAAAADSLLERPPIASPSRRRRRRVAAAVIVLALLVVAAVTWLRSRPSGASTVKHPATTSTTEVELTTTSVGPLADGGKCVLTGSAHLDPALPNPGPPIATTLTLGSESAVSCPVLADAPSGHGTMLLSARFPDMTMTGGHGTGHGTIRWDEGTTSHLNVTLDLVTPSEGAPELTAELRVARGVLQDAKATVHLSGWSILWDAQNQVTGVTLQPTGFDWVVP